MWVQSLGQEDPLEEGRATHSNSLLKPLPQEGLGGGKTTQRRAHRAREATGLTVSISRDPHSEPGHLKQNVLTG